LFYFKNIPFDSFLKLYVSIEVICCTVISIFMVYIIVNYENKIADHLKQV
jgi:hypothetical protein